MLILSSHGHLAKLVVLLMIIVCQVICTNKVKKRSIGQYRPSETQGARGKSGQQHLESVGFIFPDPPFVNEAASFCRDFHSLSRYKQEKLIAFKNIYIEGRHQYGDIDEGSYRELFYKAVESYQKRRAGHQRAYYIKTICGMDMKSSEAEELRKSRLQIIKENEGADEKRKRRERTLSSYKSRVKRMLKKNPNDPCALHEMQRRGWTREELENRRPGRKAYGTWEIENIIQGGPSSAPQDQPQHHYEQDREASTLQMQPVPTSEQPDWTELDLNEPASLSDEDLTLTL